MRVWLSSATIKWLVTWVHCEGLFSFFSSLSEGGNGANFAQPSRINSSILFPSSFCGGREGHFFVPEKVANEGMGRHKGLSLTAQKMLT